MYWHSSTIDVNALVADLRQQGPYWDRHEGADHIFVITAAPGRCAFPHDILRKAIFLHHHGQLRRHDTATCDLFETWGAACDPVMQTALGAIHGDLQQGCHIPHQDVIVPPAPFEFVPDVAFFVSYPSPYTNDELKGINRTIKLYYSGKIGARWLTFIRSRGPHCINRP